jgi:nucleotide-binding universal stress UspA family protein
MIKDILVNLSVDSKNDVAGNYALSIASAFKSFVCGIAFNYEPILPDTFADGAGVAFIESQRIESEKAAKAAIARFSEGARRAGISTDTHMIEATFGGAAGQFGEMARRFDLSVVGQSEPERAAAEDLLIEAALFESGRPVVIVPYIQKAPLKVDRILICWDGKRSAARAIADAMPFLERAKGIAVLTVSAKEIKHGEPEGADILDHLKRRGLTAKAQHVVSRDADVTSVILSQAADTSVDFIVMGGYGHSRLREFILGGATRGMLGAMTVPTLMSH